MPYKMTTAAICAALITLRPSAQTLPPAAAIDAVVSQELKVRGIPGAAVAVVEKGVIVFQRAYGIANLETATPVDTSSVFELASITKTFTAAAIMILVEEGRVRLDEPLSAYIDRTPSAWSHITIRHLLTHTSGLDAGAMPHIQGSIPMNVTIAQTFDFIAQQPLKWPTGEVGWYSDAGFFLLGMVIEKASGQKYREFLAHRVFEPLHMESSSVTDRARVIKGRVATYSLRDGEHVNWRRDWDHELPSFFGIWSTLKDLAAWDASLRDSTLLPAAHIAQMWTPGTLINGTAAKVDDGFYGLGWELADVRGRQVVGHQGASGTYLLRFLDEPLTIIVLTNLDVQSGQRHPRALARAIAGAVKRQYAPPHMLTPRSDPLPDVTRIVATVLADFGARRASIAMSEAYATSYRASPGAQAWYFRQLGGAAPPRYLAHDELSGRSLWGGEPLARLVHYATDVKGVSTYLSAGITADGKLGSLDFYTR